MSCITIKYSLNRLRQWWYVYWGRLKSSPDSLRDSPLGWHMYDTIFCIWYMMFFFKILDGNRLVCQIFSNILKNFQQFAEFSTTQNLGVKQHDSCVVRVCICLYRPAVNVNRHGFDGIWYDCWHRFEISSACNHLIGVKLAYVLPESANGISDLGIFVLCRWSVLGALSSHLIPRRTCFGPLGPVYM